MTDLLAAIDDLLGAPSPDAVLTFDPRTAALVRDSLRTALLGGRYPEGGRRALWVLVDALALPVPSQRTEE